MKVLLVMASPGSIVGGMEKQVALQANALNAYPDTDIAVLASAHYQKLFDPSVTFIACDMTRSRRNPVLLSKIVLASKQFRPDIIHAHGHKAAALISTVRAFQGRSKLLATAHGLKKNSTMLAKMDVVISVSKGIAKSLSPISSEVVYNGLPVPEQDGYDKKRVCEEWNLDASLPLVIGLGRFAKVKRFDFLVRAVKGLPCQLLLVGDGPERELLEKLAGSNVRFTGYRIDAQKILAAADLMVMCSEREGFSLALVEALQAGIPVVSTRVPGAEELLPEDRLLNAADPDALQMLLKRTLSRLQEEQQRFQPLFEYARKDLNLITSVQKIHSIYQSVREA